jgi:alanyl-tRNA synthetase
VFDLANAAVLTDAPVETTETSLEEAERMGAIAFFGDKYGSTVRVIQAGDTSLEFCGGTHVEGLGQIGLISLVSEESIGSNKRRIFAVTGRAALDRVNAREHLVRSAADLLRTEPDELLTTLERILARQREADKELQKLRQQSSESLATELAQSAENGTVVARQDKVEPDALRSLAQAVLRHDGVERVALAGSPDGAKVALVVATGGEPNATDVVRALGQLIGGGGGGSAELALAGGRDVTRIEEALAEARRLLTA